MPGDAQRSGWRRYWPFAVLCLLTASRWVLVEAVPEAGSTLRGAALGCVIAALGTAMAGPWRTGEKLGWRGALLLLGAGAALLAAPALGVVLRGLRVRRSIALLR